MSLVDDNLLAIFSWLPNVATKLAVSQVCTKWREIIMHPSLWKAVEVRLGENDNNHARAYMQLVKFIQRYCTSVVDICIKVVDIELHLPKNWLDAIFQIKTLQRLSILFCDEEYGHYNLKYNTTKAPNCPDLRLLNLTSVGVKEDTLKLLLERMPNLEELYLYPYNKFSKSILPTLSKCKKLQRLLVPQKVPESKIVRACPWLKYLIVYDHDGDDDEESEDWDDFVIDPLTRIGNTVVVQETVLDLSDTNFNIGRLRQLKPLLVPYTSGAIVESVFVKLGFRDINDYPIKNGVLQFLVNEMHYDLNAAGPEYTYRPSFTHSESSYRYGLFGTDVKPDYSEKYPLEAVLSKNSPAAIISTGNPSRESPDVAALRFWTELGCKPECPEPNRSYLTIAYRADTRLFLLQCGADPNKIINVKENIPVYAHMFMDPRFEDSGAVVQALMGRVDWSIEVKGKTPLGWMIENKKWESFEALMSSGMKLSAINQFTLLQHEPTKFLERIANGSIDMMTLSVEIALHMINTGLGTSIAPYINANINKIDENGYTLYHYMSMTSSEANMNNKIEYKQEEGNEFRWVLADPKSCSWRETKQRASYDLDEKDYLFDEEMEEREEEEARKKKFQLKLHQVLRQTGALHATQPPKNLQTKGPVAFVKPNITMVTKDGETGLLLVCKSRLTADAMTKRIQHNLAAKPDVNRGDKNGWTPLHALCYGQYWPAALLLLNSEADINAKDSHGVTPLMAAIYGYKHLPKSNGSNEFTENFLSLLNAAKLPIDVTATEKFSNRTLLHLAVSIDDPRLILELLKLKYDVNARDADGYTPLHVAALVGAAAKVIEILVKNGADVNAQTYSLKLTPAMVFMQIMSAFRGTEYAGADAVLPDLIYFNHLEACSNMMRGNKYYREVMVDKRPVALLTEAPWHYHKQTFDKHEGTSNERFSDCDSVFESLTRGANLTLTDVNKNNYLHFLVIMCGDNHEALLRVVQHPPLNQLWNSKNDSKISPFFALCMSLTESNSSSSIYPYLPKTYSNNMFLYDLVIKHNIDVMECDYYGMFPFYYIASAKWKHLNMQKWTALPGVDLTFEFPDAYKQTNLFDKLFHKYLVNTAMLRETIAIRPNFLLRQDPSGLTLLMRVVQGIGLGVGAQHNFMDFLEILLEHKAHLNLQELNGNTALHFACQFFNLGAVDSIRFNLQNLNITYPLFAIPFMLLEAGADPSIKNNRGETPLSYVPALMSHYQHLYKWIKSAAE